ncbi:MAG: hypothetical protein MJ240_03210 [Kiritimatiellae bacterium]|nr:hypothetical protein [Kiritimatiellia bacterium]
MKSGLVLIVLASAVLLGCSDSQPATEDETVVRSEPAPKIDAAAILEKELHDNGVDVKWGWSKQHETFTAVTSEQFNPKYRRQEKDDFIEEYDFKLPESAGECSQLAYAFWKAHAKALAEVLCYLTYERHPSARSCISCSFSDGLCGFKILHQVWAVDDARTFSCALAVQLDGGLGKRIANGGPFSPGRLTLEQKLDEIAQNATIGPDVFVDNEGTLWHLGVVPVDKEPTGMTPDWSMRLAFEFAQRTGSAEINLMREINPLHESMHRRNSTRISVKPTLRVTADDSTRVRRFTLKAKHPMLGKVQYKVCAIRD